jgi:hypothetical protein
VPSRLHLKSWRQYRCHVVTQTVLSVLGLVVFAAGSDLPSVGSALQPPWPSLQRGFLVIVASGTALAFCPCGRAHAPARWLRRTALRIASIAVSTPTTARVSKLEKKALERRAEVARLRTQQLRLPLTVSLLFW